MYLMEESHQTITPTSAKRKEVLPPVDDSPEGMEQEAELDFQSQSIEAELASKYPPNAVKLFKRLAYELSVIGLPLEDACLIIGLDYDKIKILINTDETVGRLIKVKDLEYKRGLLKVVSIKAKTDDKTSSWMLERRYPDEFNPKKGQGGGGDEAGDNYVKQAITFIQVGGDNVPLVARKSGAAREYIVEGENDKSIMKRIKDILS